jgi:hypothetical protein
MTPTELIKLVQDAPGSMYTREDVINLLNKVEAPTANATISDEVMEKIVEEVSYVLDTLCWEDVVEKEFSCDTYGSEATISCEVTVDVSDVVSRVEKALKELDLNENN